jgi:P4 family phage/plasmid primase-like protien
MPGKPSHPILEPCGIEGCNQPAIYQQMCQEHCEMFGFEIPKELLEAAKKATEPPPPEPAVETPKPQPKIDMYELIADTIQRQNQWFFEGGLGLLYWYDRQEGIWSDSGEQKIDQEVARFRRRMKGKKTKLSTLQNEVKRIIKSELTDRHQQFPRSPLHLVPMNNGVYNLDTGKLQQFKPEMYFRSKFPTNYNTEADDAFLYKLIKDWLPGTATQTALEIGGLCMYADYPVHKFYVFWGVGRNGKSRLVQIIQNILGQQNCSSQSLNGISEQFNPIELYGKYANIAEELDKSSPKTAVGDFNVLLRATGQSMIKAARKRISSVSFVNFATMIFATNELPLAVVRTHAFWSRVQMLHFPKVYDGDELDPDLPYKIDEATEATELVAREMLHALRDLRARRWRLTGQMTQEEAKEAWQNVANPIEKFINDFCYKGPNRSTPLGEFVDAFNYYLEAQGKAPQSYHQIRRSLVNGLGYQDTKKRPNYGGNPIASAIGLELRSSAHRPNKPTQEDNPF